MFDLAVFCLVVTALLVYLNHRYVGLPTTIGVMSIALLISMALLALDWAGVGALRERATAALASIDFSEVLMQGMLSLLLFAGALHVDLAALGAVRWQVGVLAVLGTLASTVLIGVGAWALLPLAGLALPFAYCLIFGALISPTDPIAVMGMLKTAGAPKSLELVIAGESLFNDGVGVVLFTVLLTLVASGEPPSVADGGLLLLREAGGGLAYGFVLGYVVYRMLRSIDNYHAEVLITLAAVMGGYALANALHVSGPLAMVVVGLLIGNQGRARAMSERTRVHLDMFWELLDEILNSVLFVLIGFEVILIAFSPGLLLGMAAAVALALAARWASIGLPVMLFRRRDRLPPGSTLVLVWGGLRGGISVALALSLPAGPERELVLALTYSVVVFSILVQGLTIGRVVRYARSRAA